MANSMMNQINVISPVVYRLDFKNYMLSFDVTTETKSTAVIDLSQNSPNETKIISSNVIYSKFKDGNVSCRSNKNSGAVKFYSYAGGKEITRLVTGSTRMSNLAYPPFSGTLFSSIILPEMNDNDTVYLLIDNCSEVGSITHPKMKKDLINRDLFMMLENIKTGINGKNIKFTILFEKNTYDELIKYESKVDKIIESYGIKSEHSQGHIVPYLCDLVFGKILGGQLHKYNGVINPENFTILDAFITSNRSIHTLTNRTSGLALVGNGTSTIYMIIRCNSELTNEIILTEITSGIELLNLSLETDVKVHKNTSEILKFIKLFDFSFLTKNIISKNDRKEMSKFMKDNLEECFNLEFNFLDSYNSDDLEEDIKVQLNNNILHYHNNLFNDLIKIRSKFELKRSLEDDEFFDGPQSLPLVPMYTEVGIVHSAPSPIPSLKRGKAIENPQQMNSYRELSCW